MPVEGAVYKVKRTDEAGKEPTSLTFGEMAVNTTDGKLFVGGPNGEIIPIISGSGGGGGVESLNGLTGAVGITSADGTIVISLNGSEIDLSTGITIKGSGEGIIQFANSSIDDLQSNNAFKFDTVLENLEVPNGIVLGTVGLGYMVFGDGTTQTSAAINFSYGTTAPSSPKAGDQWYQPEIAVLFTYFDDGSSQQWVQL